MPLSDAGIEKTLDILYGGPHLAEAQRRIHHLLIPAAYAEERANLGKAQDAMNLLLGQRSALERDEPLTLELSDVVMHRDSMNEVIAHYEVIKQREERGEEQPNVWKGYELIVKLAEGARNGGNEAIRVLHERAAETFRLSSWTRAGEGA